MTENVNVLDIDLTQTNEELNQTSKSIKDLRAEIKEYRTTLEEATIGSSEFDKALGDLTQAQDQLKNATKQTATAVEGSYDAMVQSMSELKKQWRATADEMERKDLGNKIGQLNSQLKSMDASVGNFQRNVGNYQSALEGMSGTINATGDTLQGITNGFSTAIMMMNSMGIEGEELSKVMKTMQIAMTFTNALKSLSKGSELFTKMGVAIKGAAVSQKLFTTNTTAATTATGAQTVATGAQTVATNTATVATTALSVALYALPIVGIIAGITALVSALGGFSKAANQNKDEVDKYKDSLSKLHSQWEIIDEDSNNEIRIMKAKGASLDEIHAKQVQDIQDKINNVKAIQAEMIAEANSIKSKRARAKFVEKNQEEYDNMSKAIQEMEAQIVSLDKTLATDKEVAYWENQRKGATGAAKATYDAAKALENYQKMIKTNQDKINELMTENNKTDNPFYNAALELDDWKASMKADFVDMKADEIKYWDERKKNGKISAEEYNEGIQDVIIRYQNAEIQLEKAYNKRSEKIREDYDNNVEETYKKNTQLYLNSVQDRYNAEMDLLELNRKAMTIEMENQGDSVGLNALNQEFLKQQEEKLRAVREEYIAFGQDVTEIDNAIRDNLIEQQQLFYEEFDAKKEKLIEVVDVVKSSADSILSIGDGISSEWSNVFDSISAGIDRVSTSLRKGEQGWKKYGAMAVTAMDIATSVLGALADEQDEKTQEGFETQKKFQIAQVVMNTLSGIITAWSTSMQLGPIAGPIAAGALSTLLTGLGIAQVSKIQKTKLDGGGDIDSAAASVTPSITAVGALQNGADSVYLTGGQLETQVKDQRVYVVESDISNTMNKVQTVETEAIF